MMPNAPTRFEFERLKAAYVDLQRQVESLRLAINASRQEHAIQFKRIAEMQAILDEESREVLPVAPNPLLRQTPRTPFVERRVLRRPPDH